MRSGAGGGTTRRSTRVTNDAWGHELSELRLMNDARLWKGSRVCEVPGPPTHGDAGRPVSRSINYVQNNDKLFCVNLFH